MSAAIAKAKRKVNPPTSRTMKGRVQDKKDKEAKVAKNKENWKKIGSTAVKALGGVGTALLNSKEMTGKVGQALGGVAGILFRKKKRREKGGGGTGTRVS